MDPNLGAAPGRKRKGSGTSELERLCALLLPEAMGKVAKIYGKPPWNPHGFFSILLAFSFWVAILEIWGKVGDFTLDWDSKKEEYGHFSRNHVGIEATKLA